MAKFSRDSIIVGSVIIAAIAITSAFVFFGYQLKLQQGASASVIGDSSENEEISMLSLKEEDHVYGNPNAKISLIEYSDFECPFCSRFHPTAKQLVDEFDGDVNWVYRHFPLGFHDPAATEEAIASECAAEVGGNDAFWEYSDLIYAYTPGNGKGLKSESLVTLAEEAGLDTAEFEKCIEDNDYRDLIKWTIKEGKKLGVSGTPASFIINHETEEVEFISGAQSFEKIQFIINGML